MVHPSFFRQYKWSFNFGSEKVRKTLMVDVSSKRKQQALVERYFRLEISSSNSFKKKSLDCVLPKLKGGIDEMAIRKHIDWALRIWRIANRAQLKASKLFTIVITAIEDAKLNVLLDKKRAMVNYDNGYILLEAFLDGCVIMAPSATQPIPPKPVIPFDSKNVDYNITRLVKVNMEQYGADDQLEAGLKLFMKYLKANDPQGVLSRASDQSFVKRKGKEDKRVIMDVWNDLLMWSDGVFAQFSGLKHETKSPTHRTEQRRHHSIKETTSTPTSASGTPRPIGKFDHDRPFFCCHCKVEHLRGKHTIPEAELVKLATEYRNKPEHERRNHYRTLKDEYYKSKGKPSTPVASDSKNSSGQKQS